MWPRGLDIYQESPAVSGDKGSSRSLQRPWERGRNPRLLGPGSSEGTIENRKHQCRAPACCQVPDMLATLGLKPGRAGIQQAHSPTVGRPRGAMGHADGSANPGVPCPVPRLCPLPPPRSFCSFTSTQLSPRFPSQAVPMGEGSRGQRQSQRRKREGVAGQRPAGRRAGRTLIRNGPGLPQSCRTEGTGTMSAPKETSY